MSLSVGLCASLSRIDVSLSVGLSVNLLESGIVRIRTFDP